MRDVPLFAAVIVAAVAVYAGVRARALRRLSWAERTEPERLEQVRRFLPPEPRWIRVLDRLDYVLALVAVLGGSWLLWDTQFHGPDVYRTLEDRGVLVSAVAERRHIDPGRAGGPDHYYFLTFQFRDRRHELRVFDNLVQFDGQFLDRIPVLVDPENPGTARTVADVRDRTNEGINKYSIIAVLAIVGGVVWLLALLRARRRSRPADRRPPARPPPRPLDALGTLEDLVSAGQKFPPTGQVKVDYSAAAAAVAQLRADYGSPHPPALGLPALDSFERLLQAGYAGPPADAATIDAAEANNMLAGMRLVLTRQSEITQGLG